MQKISWKSMVRQPPQSHRWRRPLAAIAVGLVVVGGLATVAAYRSSAEASDGYDSINALADAAKIPNDQGPAPCPSTSGSVTPQHRHHNGGRNGGGSAAPGPVAAPASDSPSPTDSGGTGADPASPDPSATDTGQPAPAPSDTAPAPGAAPSASATGAPGDCGGHATGPLAADFVSINSVPVSQGAPAPGRNASRGTFTSRCGTNANGHRNPDNFIVAPGKSNGAHHTHDYVGNLTTDGFSTDASLAAGGTTCRFGDLSAYYWPVLRRIGTQGTDATAPGGGADGNVGSIISPASATIQFRGNFRTSVVAMPRFLRIITGDAKAVTNGPANARAQWTCAGFTNRFTTSYPLCPRGRGVQRVLDFASCWDGINTDSANHRSQIVFPLASGRCPRSTVAVPQLRLTLTYNVSAGRSFALDTFPEQNHSPITDHADFENVMPDNLMAFAVTCINTGRSC